MARVGRCSFAVLGIFAAALAAPPEAHYVGSKACYGCHAEIYRSYRKTDMGRSMRPAADLDNAGVPAEATKLLSSSTRIMRVFRDQAGWHQSESELNVFVDAHKLEYIIGSGTNGLSCIVRRGNSLFQAPLSYYSKVGKWDLSPGYEYGDYGFSRSTPEGCVFCHSGRAQPVLDRPGEYSDPPFLELAIGCENCHGPGEAHANDPKRSGTIVNPAKLTPRLAENICMGCHQRGDARILQPGKTFQDVRPGQWLIDTVAILKIRPQNEEQREQDLLEHNAAMEASRCFRESGGKLSCLTCHDPHIQPNAAEVPSYFRAKCLTCHTEQSCRLSLAARQQGTPSDDCAGCHMPKRDIAVISHSALTNHRIPARPNEPLASWQPSPDTGLLLVDQPEGQKREVSSLTLLRAYSELANRSPEYEQRYLALLDRLSHPEVEDPFVQAALAHRALADGKNEEALMHLTVGIRLGEATVYEDKAKALANLGRGDEALAVLRQGVEIHPYDQEMRKNLILECINFKRYTEARNAMNEYVTLFPEDDFMRKLLQRVSS
jgi:hypothetical protein